MRALSHKALWFGVLGGLASLAQPSAGAAASLKGIVNLPAELKSGRRFSGYWRVENGTVPVQAAAVRNDTVVVLLGPKAPAPTAQTVSVEIAGLAPSRSTLVVAEGSVVEIRNSDKVPHDLAIPDQPSIMPMERLAGGGVRRVKFLAAGAFAIRDNEYPHLVISVVVMNTPFHAQPDDKGAFKLPDAPDGKATLKVWSSGRWVHEEEVDLGKTQDLQINVRASSKASAE
jgi:hypothetical protein